MGSRIFFKKKILGFLSLFFTGDFVATYGALAQTMALPPKTWSFDWSEKFRQSLQEDAKIIERRPRSINFLTRTPQLRPFLWRSREGRILAPDLESPGLFFELPSFQSRWLSSSPNWTPAGLREHRSSYGEFFIENSVLHFRAKDLPDRILWQVPLGAEMKKKLPDPLGIVAWSYYPSKISFFEFGSRLNAAEARLNFIHWSEDSEIVSVGSCDASRLTILERLPNGFARLYFANKNSNPNERWVLAAYTVFKFESQNEKSEWIAMSPLSCQHFYMSGTFGLVEVLY